MIYFVGVLFILMLGVGVYAAAVTRQCEQELDVDSLIDIIEERKRLARKP